MVIGADQIGQTRNVNGSERPDNNAVARELQRIADLKHLQQQQMDTKAYQNLIQDAKQLEALRAEKGYQAKLQKDPGIKILSSLARDLAALGIDISARTLKKSSNTKLMDELEHALGKQLLKEDELHLSKEAVKRGMEKEREDNEEQQQSQQRSADIKQLVNDPDVKEAIQQYSAAYAEEVIQSNPDVWEKAQGSRSNLKQKGFSENDIQLLEKSLRRSLGVDIASGIQNSFIQHVFSPMNAFQLVAGQEEPSGKLEGAVKAESHKVMGKASREEVRRTQTREDKKTDEEKDLASRDLKGGTVKLRDSSSARESVQQYSAALAQFAVNASPETREKLEDAQKRLKERGFSEKEIISIERAAKRSYRADYVSDLKDSFTQHMFSPKNSFQFIVTGKNLNNAFDEAIKGEKLSGISGDRQVVQEELSRITKASHEEIKDFVRDAVESKLMERHISEKNNRNEVKKLVELGQKVGFNFDNFLKTWEKKKFDLGLFIMEIDNATMAENAGQISIGEVSAGGVSDKHGYEMTKDEEKELLINKLRAEYLKRAITGDPFAVFNFAPKIRKLKNGLIKLGLEAQDFGRIEKEAKALARYRTLEMLKGSFIERSTYYELSGPAYNLLKNKMKGMTSNLKNLDMDLTKDQLDMLRDDANRQMHDHAIIELKSSLAILENHGNPSIEEKVPLLIKLIQRLREESGFTHGIGEDIDNVIFRQQNGQKSVKEDA